MVSEGIHRTVTRYAVFTNFQYGSLVLMNIRLSIKVVPAHPHSFKWEAFIRQ